MSDSEAGASHISDEEVFKRKLLMDGEGMGDDRKIDTLFSSFIQWCDAQGQKGEEIADGYERLLAQLDYLKFSSQRSAERQRASAREIEELDKILTNMEKEVTEEKKVIAERHLELKEAKKVRLNKMKYDALGRIISSLPDRKDSMKQLERIEGDIKTLKLQKEALQKDSDEREKHLRLLLTATHELKYKFRKELEDWEDASDLGLKHIDIVLEEMHSARRLIENTTDMAKKQYAQLTTEAQSGLQSIFTEFTDNDSDNKVLDEFYYSVIGDNKNFRELWNGMKIVFLISYGNTSVESEFSINKNILVDNLTEDSVVLQRMEYDSVNSLGGQS